MRNKVICPHCDELIRVHCDDYDGREEGEYFNMECVCCGNEFYAFYEIALEFDSRKKEVMKND